MTDNTNQAMAYRPTLAMRFWNTLGFGYPNRDRLEDLDGHPDFCEAYLAQTIHVQFDWKDRLRLLLTGHAVIEQSTKTDVLINRAVARSTVGVLSPMQRGNGGRLP